MQQGAGGGTLPRLLPDKVKKACTKKHSKLQLIHCINVSELTALETFQSNAWSILMHNRFILDAKSLISVLSCFLLFCF